MIMNSWRALAVGLLREKGPLSADEIVNLIAERGLREISGRTPSATVAAALYTACKRGDPELYIIRPGTFAVKQSNAGISSQS
jgi:hypothetical protein